MTRGRSASAPWPGTRWHTASAWLRESLRGGVQECPEPPGSLPAVRAACGRNRLARYILRGRETQSWPDHDLRTNRTLPNSMLQCPETHRKLKSPVTEMLDFWRNWPSNMSKLRSKLVSHEDYRNGFVLAWVLPGPYNDGPGCVPSENGRQLRCRR